MHQQAHRLQGVAHDVFRFGIGVRLLMQQFDARHLLAGLGNLDAIGDQNASAINAQRVGEQAQRHRGPQRAESINLHAIAVKAIEQVVVQARLQLERPHDAGHSQQIGANGKTSDHCGEPHEAAQTRERRAQQPHRIPPSGPKRHRFALKGIDKIV